MSRSVILLLLVAACFFAAVLNLAAENRLRRKIMNGAILCAVSTGAFFYGAGYAYSQGLSVSSLMRALLALCRMFGGINDFGAISSFPPLASEAGLAVFWFGHFCAFYVTASAAIATLGDQLLRTIRVTLLRYGPLLVIFGVNDNSVSYGKSMADAKRRSVLYIDPDGNTPYESTITAFGAVIEKNSDALSPNKSFLEHINIRPGARKVELAALHADGRRNLAYAKAFLAALDEAGISPDQTSLLISGAGEESALLQAQEGPKYGSVLAFDDYALTARLLLRDAPPADCIRFDLQGKAMENFHVVIIGFGRMGRAVLDAMVCGAQFCGSAFTADIFDPNPQNGFLYDHEMLRQYSIKFHRTGGKSEELYTFLSEKQRQISFIVVCTGSRQDNSEILRDLAGWYETRENLLRIPMLAQVVCGSYFCTDREGKTRSCDNIFTADTLDLRRIDAMAMQIHHMYTGGPSAEEDWAGCSYWGRLSSRASADYFYSILRACGKTSEEVLAGDWPPNEGTLENLGISEHLRWCAFHIVNGYRPMPEEEFAKRAEKWREETAKNGSSSVSLTKDTLRRLHACLIPWEDLDALSAREFEITGKQVDYKQMDRNNVIAMQDVLREAKRDL